MSRTIDDVARERDEAEARNAELEAALRPFAEAFDSFTKHEAFTRVLSLDQLGRLASGKVSGAHFKAASEALTK